MRLVGSGSTANEGNVEWLSSDGTWDEICDGNFDINDANVICRMLDFPSAIAKVDKLQCSQSECLGSSFVFKNLDCTGGEASIFDCPLSGEWNEDCDASEKAGVQCAIQGES